jgi:hypothetical protein
MCKVCGEKTSLFSNDSPHEDWLARVDAATRAREVGGRYKKPLKLEYEWHGDEEQVFISSYALIAHGVYLSPYSVTPGTIIVVEGWWVELIGYDEPRRRWWVELILPVEEEEVAIAPEAKETEGKPGPQEST